MMGHCLPRQAIAKGSFIYSEKTHRMLASLKFNSMVSALCFSPNNRHLAIGSSDGDLVLLSLEDYTLSPSFHIRNAPLTSIQFDGELTILTDSYDNAVSTAEFMDFKTKPTNTLIDL